MYGRLIVGVFLGAIGVLTVFICGWVTRLCMCSCAGVMFIRARAGDGLCGMFSYMHAGFRRTGHIVVAWSFWYITRLKPYKFSTNFFYTGRTVVTWSI